MAERVGLIYWILKKEIANQKVASLQTLVNRIGNNDRLRDLRHTSSSAVSEFILLIYNHLSDRIVSAVQQNPCWATMVDHNRYYNFAAIYYICSIYKCKSRPINSIFEYSPD